LGFLLALGAYYFLYAQKKTAYLVGRDFRLLATTGDGVRASLMSYGEFLKSRGKEEISGWTTYACDPTQGSHLRLGRPGGPIEVSAAQSVCARLDPDKLFEPFFKPLAGSKGAFDQILLTRESGDVFYQYGAPDLRITQLGPLLAKSEPKDSKPAGAAQTPTLSASASYHNVEIGGREFKLFIQPVDLPMEAGAATGDGRPGTGQGTWLLCGLVVADKFVYKSLAVPSSFLLVILAILLLAALSWPLVRLRLMGEWQRVRILDVLLLGICSLLGVAIVTLSVVDFYAYSELRRVAERQLEELATVMAGNISKEIEAAHRQLVQLERRLPSGPPEPMAAASWNDFSLVDSKGMQKLKWSADGKVRPLVKVDDRGYFLHALHDKTWTLAGSGGEAIGPFYLESVTARSTLQQVAVLAEPVIPSLRSHDYAVADYAVATLAIPMRSVIRPVTPGGFDFAVIDDDGAVLFHKDPSRNGVENFFTETDDDHRLRSAVFARHGGEPMGVRYFGKDYMAWLQPIPGLPWTVVALRSKEQSRTLNMEWVVTTVLFLLLSAVPFVVVLLTIVIARPGYRAPWMWPDPVRPA
ncbi:MAG TPA: cache domain-containing protein, partial [Thermoanaerobaculia bacterium]